MSARVVIKMCEETERERERSRERDPERERPRVNKISTSLTNEILDGQNVRYGHWKTDGLTKGSR